MSTQLVLALDVDTREEALAVVRASGACQWFKVGFQLFIRCGPDIVSELRAFGKSVFLDLKLHDIPNTVANAARAAADLGVELLTLHAAGGRSMIAAARQAVTGSTTRLLAVTVLTSLSDGALRDEVGLPETAAQAVMRYAQFAVDAGAHGLVASPQELPALRAALGRSPLIVTPGVRPAWAETNDQARVMTPRQAAEAGADFIVVGRPILKHPNPAEAVRLIIEDLTL